MPQFNDAFWRWFSDSKVVDENGHPLVVYHGTSAVPTDAEPFRIFRMHGLGAHFGTKQQAETRAFQSADKDAPPYVFAVYLKIENPAPLSDWGEAMHDTEGDFWENLVDEVLSLLPFELLRRPKDHEQLVDLLKQAGFDGIVYRNAFEGSGNAYVVFSPNQIKSAIGNDGTWDADDPNIGSNPPEKNTLERAKQMGARIAAETEAFLNWMSEKTETDYAPVDAVYFYGSRARGDSRPDSDWDFIVVGEDFCEAMQHRIELSEGGEIPSRFRKFDLGGSDLMTTDIVFDEIKSTSPLRFKDQSGALDGEPILVWSARN